MSFWKKFAQSCFTRHQQNSGIDLVDAMNGVNDLLESLQRLCSAEEFSKLFVDAANLAELLGTNITVPRIPSRCGRPVFRSSSAIDSHGDDEETYFRINYFYPMLDNLTTDLRLRFGSCQQQCAQLASAIPFHIGERSKNCGKDCNSEYSSILNFSMILKHY